MTGDRAPHQLLDRPRNMPTRTAFGAAVVAMAVVLQLTAADDLIAFHFRVPVEDVLWTFRAGFFVAPAAAFALTRHVCLSLQRADRRRLRLGFRYGIAALPASDGAAASNGAAAGNGAAELPASDGADGARGYAAVSRPASPDEQAVLQTRRPDELITATPRHLVPLPTPRRAVAQLRARLNHYYVVSRLETPNQDGTDAEESEDQRGGDGS